MVYNVQLEFLFVCRIENLYRQKLVEDWGAGLDTDVHGVCGEIYRWGLCKGLAGWELICCRLEHVE